MAGSALQQVTLAAVVLALVACSSVGSSAHPPPRTTGTTRPVRDDFGVSRSEYVRRFNERSLPRLRSLGITARPLAADKVTTRVTPHNRLATLARGVDVSAVVVSAPRTGPAPTALVFAACASAVVSDPRITKKDVERFTLPKVHTRVTLDDLFDIGVVTTRSEVGYVCLPEGAPTPVTARSVLAPSTGPPGAP